MTGREAAPGLGFGGSATERASVPLVGENNLGNSYSGTFGEYGSALARDTVSGTVAGLTTAALRGGRIGAMQVATDAFGNALGGSLTNANSSAGGDLTGANQGDNPQPAEQMGAANDVGYNQLVDAFSIPTNSGYMGDGSFDGTQFSANGVPDPWQPAVMSDAGSGTFNGLAGLGSDSASRTGGMARITQQAMRETSDASVNTSGRLHVDINGVGSTGVDAMGNVTGAGIEPIDNYPTRSYGDQRANVGGFMGTVAKNFAIGVGQGTIGLAGDAVKGWAMIGDMAFNGGSNINQIDQLNTRPLQYDAGIGQFAGGVGEVFSPGAYVKGAQLGINAARALGPTDDAAMTLR